MLGMEWTRNAPIYLKVLVKHDEMAELAKCIRVALWLDSGGMQIPNGGAIKVAKGAVCHGGAAFCVLVGQRKSYLEACT